MHFNTTDHANTENSKNTCSFSKNNSEPGGLLIDITKGYL